MKRSQSSPLIINCPLRASSGKLENSLCKVKIINGIQNVENSQFNKCSIKPQVNLIQSKFSHKQGLFTESSSVNHCRSFSPLIKIAQH